MDQSIRAGIDGKQRTGSLATVYAHPPWPKPGSADPILHLAESADVIGASKADDALPHGRAAVSVDVMFHPHQTFCAPPKNNCGAERFIQSDLSKRAYARGYHTQINKNVPAVAGPRIHLAPTSRQPKFEAAHQSTCSEPRPSVQVPDLVLAKVHREMFLVRQALALAGLASTAEADTALEKLREKTTEIAALIERVTQDYERRLPLDLPGFCGERLAHFRGFSVEGDWALEAER